MSKEKRLGRDFQIVRDIIHKVLTTVHIQLGTRQRRTKRKERKQSHRDGIDRQKYSQWSDDVEKEMSSRITRKIKSESEKIWYTMQGIIQEFTKKHEAEPEPGDEEHTL